MGTVMWKASSETQGIDVNGSKRLSPSPSVSNLSLRPCRYLSTVTRSSSRGSVDGFRRERLQTGLKVAYYPSDFSSHHELFMFKAMCAMAFFVFLRIGEITVSKRDSVNGNLLQLDQVSKKHSGNGNVVSLIITFTSYKHNYNQNPFSIVLNRQPKACPVQSFLDYVSVRGIAHGPLFINHDGSPVLRSEFSKMLGSVIRLCNLDPNRYKGHSFRIGAATYAAEQGVSDNKIRHLGKWKSDAFKKYIRITSLESVS